MAVSQKVKDLQWYMRQYVAHHKLPGFPTINVDGIRGPQTVYATRLVMYYLGFDGTNWRHATAYNRVSDDQRIQWLRNPSSRNPAMRAKGKYRQDHKPKPATVVIDAGANLPGRPIHAHVLDDVHKIAAYAGQVIHVICGTNHCKYVLCNPSQNISDHWAGNATDLSPNGRDDGPNGDLICASALRVAGYGEQEAWDLARGGGEHVNFHGGYRYDVLWKTDIGGNHHNHIHFGVRPA